MPIYIYRCESCGVQFERHQSFTDEPLKRCPECNKNSLRKVLTPAGIVFKGSGWYATDHKSSSGLNRPPKSEGKEASASASEGSSSSSSQESSSGSSSTSETSSNASKPESSAGKSEGSNSKSESSSRKSESSSKSSE